MSDPSSGSDASARPRQLTMAGWFVVGGSVFLLLSVFDTLSTLQSVETRQRVTDALTSATGQGLGISVSEALSAMRVGLMVSAACAAAAAVAGVFVLQRHRGARLALTVLAVPILLTAPLTGGIVGALVAAATVVLWTAPARDWFAGRPVRQPETAARPEPVRRAGPWERTDQPGPGSGGAPGARTDDPPSAPPSGPPPSSLSTSATSSEPGPTAGFGQPTEAGQVSAPGLDRPPPEAYAAQPVSDAVPVPVRIACLLTWAFSGLVALLYAGLLVALVVAQDRLVELVVSSPEWQRANLQQDMLVPVLWLGCLMFLGWSLGACVLAWFTWRRHNWARWLLAASAAAALVAALFAFPVGMLHQVAAALTIAGLFSATSRAWFAQRPWSGGAPPSGPGEGDPHSRPVQPVGHGQGQGGQTSGGKPPVW